MTYITENTLPAKLADELAKRANKIAAAGPISFENVILGPMFLEEKENGIVVPMKTVKIAHVNSPKRFSAIALVLFNVNAPVTYFYGEEVEVDIDSEMTCVACNAKRHRNKVYLIKDNDTGQIFQVGSSCLNKYFPKAHIEMLIDYSEFVTDPMSYSEKFSSPQYFNLEKYVSSVLVVLENSTLDDAVDQFHKGQLVWTDARLDDAKNAIQHIKDLDTLNDFTSKLLAISVNGFFKEKQSKMAAWVAMIYKRKLLDEKRKETLTNEFVGDKGDNIKMSGTVLSVKYIDGYYGSSLKVTITGDDKNLYTTYVKPKMKLEKDQKISFSGKVKKHYDFQGLNYTQLNYFKKVEKNC